MEGGHRLGIGKYEICEATTANHKKTKKRLKEEVRSSSLFLGSCFLFLSFFFTSQEMLLVRLTTTGGSASLQLDSHLELRFINRRDLTTSQSKRCLSLSSATNNGAMNIQPLNIGYHMYLLYFLSIFFLCIEDVVFSSVFTSKFLNRCLGWFSKQRDLFSSFI